jgi:hypothetical protein
MSWGLGWAATRSARESETATTGRSPERASCPPPAPRTTTSTPYSAAHRTTRTTSAVPVTPTTAITRRCVRVGSGAASATSTAAAVL